MEKKQSGYARLHKQHNNLPSLFCWLCLSRFTLRERKIENLFRFIIPYAYIIYDNSHITYPEYHDDQPHNMKTRPLNAPLHDNETSHNNSDYQSLRCPYMDIFGSTIYNLLPKNIHIRILRSNASTSNQMVISAMTFLMIC